MTHLRRILTGTALVVMAAGLANASSILTVNCSVASGSTELGNAAPPNLLNNTNGSVSCAGDSGLNPAWITGIQITIDGNIIAPSTITLINNDTAPHTFSAST